MPRQYALLSYEEALIALYLCFKDSYTVMNLAIELPRLSGLPFLDSLAEDNNDLKCFNKEPHEHLSPTYIRNQLSKCESRHSTHSYLVLNDRKAFNLFIKEYAAWYEKGQEMYNYGNAHLFELSYHHTVELLQKLEQRFGQSFNLTEKELADIQSESDRWVEILLTLYLKGDISIQPSYISLTDNERNPKEGPEFSFVITLLRPLTLKGKVLDSYCEIQITKDKSVFYKGYQIPMDPTKNYFKLLEYLVEAKGKKRTCSDFSKKAQKAKFSRYGAEKSSSFEARLSQSRIFLLSKFKEASDKYKFSIDFDVHCGKENVSLQPKKPKSS